MSWNHSKNMISYLTGVFFFLQKYLGGVCLFEDFKEVFYGKGKPTFKNNNLDLLYLCDKNSKVSVFQRNRFSSASQVFLHHSAWKATKVHPYCSHFVVTVIVIFLQFFYFSLFFYVYGIIKYGFKTLWSLVLEFLELFLNFLLLEMY